MALSHGKHAVTILRFLQLLGAVCLVIVVLTHIAEGFQFLPAMGWGLPNSAGHYLDFVSAILGCTLLPLGFIGSALTRRKNLN
jgi:ABC-type transport system involved in multi-copper enzyme maturation permease subunit